MGPAVPREIGDKHAQILQSEGLREIRHDFLVGSEAVKQHDRALRGIVACVNDVGHHTAAAGIHDDRRLAIRR